MTSFEQQIEEALKDLGAASVAWYGQNKPGFWDYNIECFRYDQHTGLVVGLKTSTELANELFDRYGAQTRYLLWLYTMSPDSVDIDETCLSKQNVQTRQMLYYNVYEV